MITPRFTNFTLEIERDVPLNKAGASGVKALGLDIGLEYSGLVIKRLKQGSAAENAGLREGDLVMQIDGVATRYMPIRKATQLLQNPKSGFANVTLRRSALLGRK